MAEENWLPWHAWTGLLYSLEAVLVCPEHSSGATCRHTWWKEYSHVDVHMHVQRAPQSGLHGCVLRAWLVLDGG